MDLQDVQIQSAHVVVSAAVTDLGLGAVPSGMKRWITFIKQCNEDAAANSLFLCSGTTATDATAANAKDKQFLAGQYDTMAYPDSPNVKNPLFSIAASKYLAAYSSGGNTGLFVQFYDL